MRKTHSITANGTSFTARTGELILDAALASGVALPHDCRAGRCGSCVVRVVDGVVLGGQAAQRKTIYACQARALADLVVEYDDPGPVDTSSARVASLANLTADVVQVGIALDRPIIYRPGQYCQFRFLGYPSRCFSPTLPADGSATSADITLHVKRVRNGRVSTALGREIAIGHRLRVEGPFGNAYLRAGSAKRLVLVAGGTGYAPILSVAAAALAEDHARPIDLIVGMRKAASFYMVEGLIGLLRHPNVRIMVAIGDLKEEQSEFIRRGEPSNFLPALTGDDANIRGRRTGHGEPRRATRGECQRGVLLRPV